MKIASIDINRKTFNKKIMGLDPAEVRTFLRAISEEMERLTRERNNLKDRLREQERSLQEHKERDKLLQDTMTTVTKMSERIKEDAHREAELIVEEARQKAEAVQNDSRDSLRRLFADITELKKIRMQFENNIRAITQSHLQMLGQARKIMPDPEIPDNVVSFDERDVLANEA